MPQCVNNRQMNNKNKRELDFWNHCFCLKYFNQYQGKAVSNILDDFLENLSLVSSQRERGFKLFAPLYIYLAINLLKNAKFQQIWILVIQDRISYSQARWRLRSAGSPVGRRRKAVGSCASCASSTLDIRLIASDIRVTSYKFYT